MSNCIHCDALHLYNDGAYCLYSWSMIDEDNNKIDVRFLKIPSNILNSDADTPGWCPIKR